MMAWRLVLYDSIGACDKRRKRKKRRNKENRPETLAHKNGSKKIFFVILLTVLFMYIEVW